MHPSTETQTKIKYSLMSSQSHGGPKTKIKDNDGTEILVAMAGLSAICIQLRYELSNRTPFYPTTGNSCNEAAQSVPVLRI